MKKYLSFILCSLLLISFVSCGDDDNGGIGRGKQTVTVKITGSANLIIDAVVIVTGTGETQTYSDLTVSEWSKEITFESVIAVSASGFTLEGASGNMKAQILKGNTVLKESTSEGPVLVTSVSYPSYGY